MSELLTQILLIVTFAIAIAIIILLIITFSISRNINKKFDRQLKDASNSIRIYTIDLDNEVVTFFNRSNLRNRTTVSLIQFYEHFPVEEREDLISWVNDLINDENDVQKYKEIHVIAKHRKNNFFSFLEVKDIDYLKRVIRIDSYLLKTTNVKKSKKDDLAHFSSQENFNNFLSASNAHKGYTAVFDFYNVRNSDDISPLVFTQLKNIFKGYILPNRSIIELSQHQIVISDLRASNKLQFVQLINSLRNEINSYLMISSLTEQIGFVVAATENKFMHKEPEKLVTTIVSLAEIAKEDHESIIWYEEGRQLESEHGDETYRTEVERIIKDKKLRYTYRPIVDLDKQKVVGYHSFVEPLDSFFGNIKELKSYASRTEDDRTLFTTIARNTITGFSQEKANDSQRLFLPVNNFERHYVNRTFAHIANIKSVHIVLIYDEEELNNLTDNTLTITEIRNFKSRGYEVALDLSDGDMSLPQMLYESFDYFLVDVDENLTSSNKSVQRSLLSFRGLVERLLKFHKPIIAINIPTWDTVELINKLGIPLVSSDAIAPSAENVLPLSTKSVLKIKNLKK